MSFFLEKLEKARPLVLQAGDIVKSYLDEPEKKQIEYKGSVNLLTAADKASEEYLFSKLTEIFPQDSILAEEGHSHEGNSGYTWVVDPIDGTTSFAHGFPMFAVSLGLVDKENHPVLGLVYNPFFDELFHAAHGCGAYVNNRPIHVTEIDTLQQSLLATGFPYNRREIMDRLMKRLASVLHKVHDVRRGGSAALDICYVAAGRLEGYFEEGLQPWDVAAALAILCEAGGKATLFDGSRADIFVPQMVATNSYIQQELLDLLKTTM